MKNILFPFKKEHDNKVAYAKAIDMAKQMNARVIFFTTTSKESAEEKDKVYFHLLELFGHYQTNYNDWNVKQKAKTKRIIKIGDFDAALKDFLESMPIDWIVPTAAIKSRFSTDFKPSNTLELIQNTKGYYPHLATLRNRVQ